MEGDRLLMAAGVTAAVVVGAFVFWGPTGASRLRQRRGQIAGLHNFGRTCFLNSLLQALSACPQFIGWLQLSSANDKKSLVSSLLSTLEVINGTHPSLRGDPHSPGSVIRALTSLGWVIPPSDDHDVHELLHVMLSSLEEELVKPKKMGCLSDALGQQLHVDIPQARPSSAMLSDFDNPEYSEMANLMRSTRSEAHTPDSPHSTCTDIDDSADTSLLDEQLASPSLNYNKINRGMAAAHENALGGSLSKRISMSYRSLDRLNRGPGRVSVWSDRTTIQVPHPFRGALSSQMTCSGCGFKSVVRYDKFDSVTLPLPEIRNPGLSLGHLLSEFIAPETLNDVTCESCNETTVHTKALTFAKLPACLCVHISRCTWLQARGQVTKRQDYVHFPESLSMAQYSFVQPGLSSQMSTPWGSTLSLLSSSFPTGGDTPTASSSYNFGAMFPRNLYRLLAVIVHSGEANSGHFVTYRRGALRNAHKWYFTSDTVVREVSIDEVLSVPAYLLFYDRGPQKSCH